MPSTAIARAVRCVHAIAFIPEVEAAAERKTRAARHGNGQG